MGESCKDDEDQLQPVHPLPTDEISSSAEGDLPDDSATGCRYFDGGIRMFWYDARLVVLFPRLLPVDDPQHGGDQIDREDIVGIGEEADSCHDDGTNMIPSKGGLIDLGQSKTSAFIGVSDVGVIIVEIVEGRVASNCFLRHDQRLLTGRRIEGDR